MLRFTRLYLDLDATTATGEKVEHLVEYLSSVPHDDAAWGLAFLIGNRPKGATSSRALEALVLERTGLPRWLVGECWSSVGDFSEVAALLIDGAKKPAQEGLRMTVESRVLPLVGAGDDAKARIISEAWDVFDADQRLVYHKLIRGGFRVGVQKRLVARALAKVAGIEPGVMSHRLAGRCTPTAEAFAALIQPEGAADEAARPYPFFLAHQLDDAPQTLGDASDWRAEWKWDGIRAQLIRRGDVVLWSRGDELITHQFPEIAAAANDLPDGCVLDGEVLLMEGDRPAPFAELQTRLNRKTAPAPGLFDVQQAVFMAYDLLEVENEDIRERTVEHRTEALQALLRPVDSGVIRQSPELTASTWNELGELRKGSRMRGVEGLMLKHRGSSYGVGRTKAADKYGVRGWWKWKIDPFSVDAVLVYAQPGSGRRAGLLTDYTFAVWDDVDGERVLTPFAKAYSGLTQEEIERLDKWLRQNTVTRTGPVRHVRPEQVFEIHFESIRRSDRHKCGLAVRFPRMARWRTDKNAEGADALAHLESLLRMVERHRAVGEALPGFEGGDG